MLVEKQSNAFIFEDSGYSEDVKKFNATCISDFLSFGKLKKWSAKTRRNYEVAVRQLYLYLSTENITFSELTPSLVVDFIDSEFGEYSANTVRTKLSVLKSFYEFLISYSRADSQPFLEIFFPKTERKLFKSMPLSVFNDFLEYLKDHSNFQLITAVKLMRYAGLRVSEAFSVNLTTDLRRVNEVYYVKLKGKGAKEREVPILSREFCAELQKIRMLYTDELYSEKLVGDQQTINYHLRKFCKQRNVGPFTSHDLRRAYARDLMAQTKDIELVRAFLGHDSYNTSLIYIQQEAIIQAESLRGVSM